jgi:short-subunit dehydrogenase
VRLSQVAVSVADLRRSQRWYREVAQLLPAGGTNTFMGPIAAAIQGVPGAASTCWWLVDAQDQFQLELFEFRSPAARPLPPDWRPSDVGYSTLGIHVGDLDAVLERAGALGSPPLGPPLGKPGERRACVRDPDGVLVELMEDDPRVGPERPRPHESPSATRFVTLSVADLDGAIHTFRDVLGLEEAGTALHGPEHEALWGLAGATSERVCLLAEDMFVELVSYSDPAPRPLPDGYRISDLGLLNVAFGFRDRGDFDTAVERARGHWLRPNSRVARLGAWSVVYVNDAQGTSIELLHVEPWHERQMGLRPRPTPRFAPFLRSSSQKPEAPRFARAVITGAGGGIGRELARLAAAEGTHLMLVDRDEEVVAGIAAELDGRVEADTRAVDFTDLDAVAALGQALAEKPDVDLLVASAGVDRARSLLDFDWREAQADFSTNTLANLVLFEHLLPAMASRGRGHVTAIASLAGLIGMPYEATYSASKAALASAMDSARAELGPRGLTFTTVFPGFVDTPMFRQNAFKHTYSIAPREAAERIWRATARRRPTLHFPAREYARIRLGRLLPARVRDRAARSAMNWRG